MIKEDELFKADIKEKLMRFKNSFRYVPCPACGSSKSSKIFDKFEQQYENCLECETVYINPRPSPDLLETYYQTSNYYKYWNDVIFPQSEEARREKIFRPRAEKIMEIVNKMGISSPTLLEVGSGFGTFGEEVKKLGVFQKIVLVEPTPDLAATCRKRGFEVIEKPIEHVDLTPDTVDAVASFEVIEHIFSPKEFVINCARQLNTGGLLILTCPNIKGFDLQVLWNKSDSIDPEHLNYFHPDSLCRLLTDSGFEIIDVETPGKLDAELVRKKALSGEMDLTENPFLKRVLLNDWEELGFPFQKFLADNKLSSHMWVTARKV
jgi:SAM-dependent methyltransferase